MAELTKKERAIVEAWDRHDDGNVSTERLLAMICDDCKCEIDAIVSAMFNAGRLQPVMPK